jgi:uncharacterized membrane protein YeaQ/YmgE (transglycosylase-associated protein family)
MSKFVKFLFWTIVAICCGVLARDLYSGNTGGAILMCISICGVFGIRWAGGLAERYDARMARIQQGAYTLSKPPR